MSNELQELKKRFTLLKPNNIPEWVCIEALATGEEHLQNWIRVDHNGEIQWSLDWIGDNEMSRISKLVIGVNALFKSDGMKYSWIKVKDIFTDSPIKSQAWFALHLVGAFIHPHEIVNTRAEAEGVKKTLLLHLEKIIQLVKVLPTSLEIEWAKQIKGIEGNENRHGIAEKIWELQHALEQSNTTNGLHPKSVHGKNSARLFFMRSLTSSFINQTGKPYRKVVADAVSSAFDCNIGESEVIRATKGINRTPINAMRAYIEKETLNNLSIAALLRDPFA